MGGICCSAPKDERKKLLEDDARNMDKATKRKKGASSTNKSASKAFLDSHQYTTQSVLQYEKIFGANFISTGGIATTSEFVNKLNLKHGQNVLDVGCGIGGSAFYMASKYKVNVLGIDLSENMLNIATQRLQEEKLNLDKNVSVSFEMCDATKRKFPENSFDVIYSRDCILHIYDKLQLFQSFNHWLKPGGILFITDYCCGDKPHSDAFNAYLNDRKYHLKTPKEYTKVIEDAGFVNVDGSDATNQFVTVLDDELNQFEAMKDDFIEEFSEKDYEYIVKGWKSKVVRCNDGDQKWGIFLGYKSANKSASKAFLDNHQYTKQGVLRYEKIFGDNFISTGGIKTTKEFVNKLDLKRGQNVLDVGCGIGGSAFYMATEYEVDVLGIDLSENMLNIATERLEIEKRSFAENVTVQFEMCDATKRRFNEGTFDVIYSRDTILHIYDKLQLFQSFNHWLKPGGILFITDYCCGDKPHSDAFNQYVNDRKYHLKTPKEYTKVIEDAGFINVDGRDETQQFVNVLDEELNQFELIKDEFIEEFSEKDYEYIVKGWKSKVVRCNDGDQKWGSFIAYKSK